MKLFDHIKETYSIKNDRTLAKELGLSHPTVSRIQSGKARVTAEIMIAIHEKYGMSIADIKAMIQ